MKQLFSFLCVVLIVAACNNDKKEDPQTDITGTWQTKTLYSEGKVMDTDNRDSLLVEMMKEAKSAELEADGDFSETDSLNQSSQANLILDRIFGLTYELKKDGLFVMNVGEKGGSNSLSFTGKYTYDPKSTDLTITLDSNVQNKVSTVKATIVDEMLNLQYPNTTKYVMKKIGDK